MTLTEFLTARLDEDEDFANGAGDFRGPRLLAEVAAKRAIVAEHEVMPWRLSGTGYVQDHDGRRWAQHYYGGCCGRCTAHGEYGGNVAEFDTDEPDYCDTMRHLGAVYADHPDYDEEWKP
jgi:hypothetical protein